MMNLNVEFKFIKNCLEFNVVEIGFCRLGSRYLLFADALHRSLNYRINRKSSYHFAVILWRGASLLLHNAPYTTRGVYMYDFVCAHEYRFRRGSRRFLVHSDFGEGTVSWRTGSRCEKKLFVLVARRGTHAHARTHATSQLVRLSLVVRVSFSVGSHHLTTDKFSDFSGRVFRCRSIDRSSVGT